MYRIAVTLFFVFTSLSSFGQKLNLENYKYIIVSDKFDFLKEIDEHQTSSLTKFLLEKKGFQVFLSNEIFPEDLSQNRCNNALFASVKDDSDFLTTKSIIVLNDCNGKNIYTSKVGKSKLKEYKKAYQESIRNAFNYMTDFEYAYKPSEKITKPLENTKSDKTSLTSVSLNQTNQLKKEVVTDEHLYAQPISNGFQLVNTKPEIVYIILKTSVKEVFLIKNAEGIVYKVGEKWFVELYQNDTLISKEITIKF